MSFQCFDAVAGRDSSL